MIRTTNGLPTSPTFKKATVSGLPSSVLNAEDKDRANLFAWRGQFTPELVDALLDEYGPTKGCVLDPFVGSGTVLIESARHGLAAIGAEINPAAALLAQTYEFANLSVRAREDCLAQVRDSLQFNIGDDLPLFQTGKVSPRAPIGSQLLNSIAALDGPAARRLMAALIISLDVGVGDIEFDKVLSYWRKLQAIVRSLPVTSQPIRALVADARDLPIPSGSIDFVLTSPPYINVFNYHQNYRQAAEALGCSPLVVAGSEIGSNRKFRQNRFLTVVQYCIDMALALQESVRVGKPGARSIYIVGRESNVRRVPFYNADLVALLAESALGFRVTLRQERVFKNRFGSRIYEDLLHLEHPQETRTTEYVVLKAREVAHSALLDAVSRASQDVLLGLGDAIEQVHSVQASPGFTAEGALSGFILHDIRESTIHSY